MSWQSSKLDYLMILQVAHKYNDMQTLQINIVGKSFPVYQFPLWSSSLYSYVFSLQESAVSVRSNIMCCLILVIQYKFMQGSGNGDLGIIASKRVSHSSNQSLLVFKEVERLFNLVYTVDPTWRSTSGKLLFPVYWWVRLKIIVPTLFVSIKH